MRWQILIVILGLFLIWSGFQEAKLNAKSDPDPQPISLVDLETKGPGDNLHVEISDFLLCDWSYVYEKSGSKYRKVWMPAMRLGGDFHTALLACFDDSGKPIEGVELPEPENAGTVFLFTDLKDPDTEVAPFAAADTVRGMVVNDIDKLGREERNLLRESYPRVDFTTCILFQVGRRPAGAGSVALYWLGGIGCVGFAVFLFLKGSTSDDAEDDERPRRGRRGGKRRTRRVVPEGHGPQPDADDEPERAPI